MESGKQVQLVIVPAEGMLGYQLCREITQGNSKVKFGKLKAGVANMNSPWAPKLKELGVEVFHLNVRDSSSLEQHFKNMDGLALVPDPSIWIGKEDEDINDMVKCCKMVCDAAVKSNVKSCLMISQINCQDSKFKLWNHWEKIEKECVMNNKWQQGHVILRKSILQEILLHYAPMIQQGHLGLPISERDELAPLSLNDLAQCSSLVLWEMLGKQERKHHGQVYNLTADQKVSAKQLVDTMNRALGGANIEFKQISEDEARRFLEEKQRLPKLKVHALLEEWQMVKDGKLSMVTNDVQKIKGQKPISLEEFVRENQSNFRPRGM